MARKYLNSSPPKSRKFAKFSLPPQKQNCRSFKIQRPSHTNVFETRVRYPASFKKPLRKPLPLRTRFKSVIPVTTRSKAAGPVSVTSSDQKKAPSTVKKDPVTNLEKIERAGSSSPKRARTDATGDEGKVQIKRVKLNTKKQQDKESSPDGNLTTGETPEPTAVLSKKDARLARKLARKSMAREIRRDWDRMPADSQQGFANITGADCYRIAVVQALLHIPAFVNWVMDHLKPENCVAEVKKNCVSCCLHQLVADYWAGDPVARAWKQFHLILKRNGWATDSSIGHADAGEQLIWIFDAISKEVPAEVYGRLEHMFRIKSASVVACGSCGHRSSSNTGSEYILNIAFQKGIKSLAGNIAEHLAAEDLDDYKCESCSETAGNQKSIEIKRLPELLCVQLNRISWNGRSGTAIVSRTAASIPAVLDLTAHRKPAKPAAQDTEREAKKVEYELLSVVKHRGDANAGHYICAAGGPDGEWNLFDDKSVTESKVGEATAKAAGFHPFIMYYQRKRA